MGQEDYWRWKNPEKYQFAFCEYAFIYDPAAKSKILQLESTHKMSSEFEDAVLRSIFIGATCPYLMLKVARPRLRRVDFSAVARVSNRGAIPVGVGGVASRAFLEQRPNRPGAAPQPQPPSRGFSSGGLGLLSTPPRRDVV